jgi:hypothetical protein
LFRDEFTSSITIESFIRLTVSSSTEVTIFVLRDGLLQWPPRNIYMQALAAFLSALLWITSFPQP